MASQTFDLSVGIRRIQPEAKLPTYATEGAAGMDLRCLTDIHVAPMETILVPLGFAVAVPSGFEMQIRPRSGISKFHPNYIANAPGTIDEDYRGEVGVLVTNHAHTFLRFKAGDRIAQAVICPVCRARLWEADELPPTRRGHGGFGSTGVE